MKIKTDVVMNLKTKEVQAKIEKSRRRALRDTVVDIARDAIKMSPWLTGNNARSLKYEVGPGGEVAKKEGEGAIYSTSGYGGYLETGTVNMAAQPYLKPALDKNIHKLAGRIRTELR